MNESKIDLIGNINKVKIMVDDLSDDSEWRVCFEFPDDYEPDLKALNALRELFGAAEEDFYLDNTQTNVHGYMVFKYERLDDESGS